MQNQVSGDESLRGKSLSIEGCNCALALPLPRCTPDIHTNRIVSTSILFSGRISLTWTIHCLNFRMHRCILVGCYDTDRYRRPWNYRSRDVGRWLELSDPVWRDSAADLHCAGKYLHNCSWRAGHKRRSSWPGQLILAGAMNSKKDSRLRDAMFRRPSVHNLCKVSS